MEIKRTERGWAGHFICAHMCRFRRNTMLECGNLRIVISTVGGMKTSRGFETIGCDRHYETMVFHAAFDGEFWDADVQREIYLSSPWSLPDLDMENEANDMHETAVGEILARIEAGEFTP